MKTFKGKAIYNPDGRAGEYSYWACNFYVGCSNQCTYCYLRKGKGAAILGGDKPMLKKQFKDEADALRVFEKELNRNLPELQKHGLFFSFTTDPCLDSTMDLTWAAIVIANRSFVKTKILTKTTEFVNDILAWKKEWCVVHIEESVAFGFTLTGHNELEPNANTNAERIEAMRKLHDAGFKTWASIEPVIDVESSFNMIFDTAGFCDLYKIGLMSGKQYTKREILWLIDRCHGFTNIYREYNFHIKFYFKDGLLKAAGIRREDLPANCVGRDYNIFNKK